MSSISSNNHIIIIGATNRIYDIDEAILRRFTRHIFIDYPTLDCRKEVAFYNYY